MKELKKTQESEVEFVNLSAYLGKGTSLNHKSPVNRASKAQRKPCGITRARTGKMRRLSHSLDLLQHHLEVK